MRGVDKSLITSQVIIAALNDVDLRNIVVSGL